MKQHKKAGLLFLTLSMLILFLSRCVNQGEKQVDARGAGYTGSTSCRQCHQQIYENYQHTSHRNASKQATKESVSGSFTKGENTVPYSNGDTVVMEDRTNGLFQVVYKNGVEQQVSRFDLTFGQKNGQTYLCWKDGKCFQLPVSYYPTVNSWGTSPGFSTGQPDFNRVIRKECFECHASFINSTITGFNTTEEIFEPGSLINGIDCERCHGPAVNHVNYHQAYPDVKKARYLVAAASLNRQQKTDLCAVCHSGSNHYKKISTFRFKSGDTLAQFLLEQPDASTHQKTQFDVHGNQLQLLAASACFIKSKSLTCNSCHNPHTDAATDRAAYTAKCISCHQNTTHTITDAGAKTIDAGSDCIKCHMPAQPSQVITYQLNGKNGMTAPIFHNHKIGIYPSQPRSVDAIAGLLQKTKRSLR